MSGNVVNSPFNNKAVSQLSSRTCFGISNVAKLLKLLDSETESPEFSSGSIQNDLPAS